MLAATFTHEATARPGRRGLITNHASTLCDGVYGTAECLAMPHLGASVVVRLAGPPAVVGELRGVATVGAALTAVGIVWQHESPATQL